MVAKQQASLTPSAPKNNPAEYGLRDAILMDADGVWTLFFKNGSSIALLDAHSREDALAQVAEMMFLKMKSKF